MPSPALTCPHLPSPALPCPHLPSPALTCPALPCPALPCAALPCPALPCPALPCLAQAAARREGDDEHGHVGAMFMTADCLLTGAGCEEDVGSAIPLLAASAELGHRFARQRMRELFDASR